MDLRLISAAAGLILFAIPGFALGQSSSSTTAPESKDRSEQIDRILERERTGSDANMATGTFGTTDRGSASGAADSAPAEGAHGKSGHETQSEPSGPASAERRPGTGTTQ